MKVFVPFSESMVERTGFDLGPLVPFQLEYPCLRILEIVPPDEFAARAAGDAAVAADAVLAEAGTAA